MSKQLERLVDRAERKYARDGYGEAVLNGRMVEYLGFGNQYTGPLEEKYAVEIEDVNGQKTVRLRHWGTQTLELNTVKTKVTDIYGISSSDRDSVNFMLSTYNAPYHVHYYPSREAFELHADYSDELIETV